ncbi:hypothetical protein HDE_01748 [Halotydeus destructor]|nr:hypothetical protein HDE_01748 [Halotydeus destructor]
MKLFLVLAIVHLASGFGNFEPKRVAKGIECGRIDQDLVCYQSAPENGKSMWLHQLPHADKFVSKRYVWTKFTGDCDVIYDDYTKAKLEYRTTCKDGQACMGKSYKFTFPKSSVKNTCAVLVLSDCYVLMEGDTKMFLVLCNDLFDVTETNGYQPKQPGPGIDCDTSDDTLICYQKTVDTGKDMWMHNKPYMLKLKEKKYHYEMISGKCDQLYENANAGKRQYRGDCKEGDSCLNYRYRYTTHKWSANNTCNVLVFSDCYGADPDKNFAFFRGKRVLLPTSQKCWQMLEVTYTA